MDENLVILTRPYLLPNHSRGSLRGRQRVDLTLSRIQRIWPLPSQGFDEQVPSVHLWILFLRWSGYRWSSGGSLERAVQRAEFRHWFPANEMAGLPLGVAEGILKLTFIKEKLISLIPASQSTFKEYINTILMTQALNISNVT